MAKRFRRWRARVREEEEQEEQTQEDVELFYWIQTGEKMKKRKKKKKKKRGGSRRRWNNSNRRDSDGLLWTIGEFVEGVKGVMETFESKTLKLEDEGLEESLSGRN